MADPLSLNAYVVQRRMKLGGLALQFMDEEGNQVLQSQGKALVTQQPLQRMDGTVISTITHKILAMTPEYDVHSGDAKGEITGIVKEPMRLMSGWGSGMQIEIRNPSGGVVATASGNFMDMQIEIRDGSGNAVARVARNLGSSGMIGKLMQLANESYRMDIVGKSVPVQTLLEFLVVLELLLARGRGSNPGLVRGGIGSGLGGFGGGGAPGRIDL